MGTHPAAPERWRSRRGVRGRPARALCAPGATTGQMSTPISRQKREEGRELIALTRNCYCSLPCRGRVEAERQRPGVAADELLLRLPRHVSLREGWGTETRHSERSVSLTWPSAAAGEAGYRGPLRAIEDL